MARLSAAERLVVALAQGIAEGRWPPGTPLPAVRDLALEMNISKPTAIKVVQRAAERGLVELRRNQPAMVLADAERVAGDLLSRIAPLPTAAPTDSPAKPDEPALKRIALLYPDIDWDDRDANLPRVALRHHLDLLSRRAGLRLDLIPWPLKDQVTFALSLRARGYVGAVCHGMRAVYQVGMQALANQRFPTVIATRRMTQVGLPVVTADDYKLAHDLAVKLVQLGHRNLSLVTDLLPTVDMEAHPAIRGWVDALDEAGVMPQCPLATYILPDLEPVRRNPRVFAELLLRPDRPTALFFPWAVWHDVLLRDPRFAQFRVPDDISLIVGGLGDRPFSLPGSPPLSTLTHDHERMAECIIKTLLDLMTGKSCPKLLLLPMKLNLTDSVGPAPGSR